MSSSHKYCLGSKVPFSWENKPGISKATQQTHTYRELPPPPCPTHDLHHHHPPSLQDFQLPLPPCPFQPSLSRTSSTKALREDPFLVAFQECTKQPSTKAKTSPASHKYGARSGFGSWFGFSCTRSSSVRDDSLVRVSRAPYYKESTLKNDF